MNEKVENFELPAFEFGSASIRLRLLGSFSLSSVDGRLFPVTSKKNRAMLAILALSPGQQITRERLCGLLWGDRGEEQARSSLRQSLAVLRKELGEVETLILQVRDDLIGLRSDTLSIDTTDFARLANASDAAALRQAAALYRGQALADTVIRDTAFEDWLAGERRQLDDLAISALEKLAKLETGSDAIATAKRLIDLDALREASHRVLMTAFANTGENGLALRQYEICQNILRKELGVEPARQTQELRQKIAERPVALEALAQPIENVSPVRKDTNRHSIAVLPFTNLSGDPAQDYFSDGITEDINTELARYHSLSVVARNSSFQFRGPGVDLSAVRRVLGVRYIVDGSIRKTGTSVRVSARLIDAESGNHLWAERYDRTMEEVFAVQDEVVQMIVSTLEGRLAAAGAAQVRAKPTTSWVAYDYFLQGRELSNRYKIHEADGFLARAIELDPGYVHAYAWRASTLVAKYWYDQKPETLQQAVVCAGTALSLDDSDAWCHQAMGFVSLHSNKLGLAGMHFERAMSLNPNDVNITADYANWLGYMGRFDEALRYLDLAMQRDPFPPSWMWEIRGTVLLQSKRYEEAIGAFHKAPIENFFTHALLAAAYAWAGQMENARREVALALAGRPDLTVSLFAQSPYADEAHRKHILDGLRMAGLPERMTDMPLRHDKPSIAVLPFANLSGDASQQHIADGLTEDLITDLSKVPGFFVIAASSIFKYRGTATEPAGAARELGARYVVQGSVRKAIDRLRINAQLIDANSGGVLWADRFDRDFSTIFDLQEEIALKIAGNLGETSLPVAKIERYRPSSLEAYDLCMQGREAWRISDELGLKAINLFERAIELDPRYPEAYRWLAMSHNFSWILFGKQMQPARDLAMQYAKKAVELDPLDSSSHFVLAVVLTYDRRWDEANAAYDVALQLNPNNADAWADCADLRVIEGKGGEAIKCCERAFQLNPRPSAYYYLLLGQAQFAVGDYEAAVKTLRDAATYRTESRRFLAAALSMLGRVEEARNEGHLFALSNPQFSISRWVEIQPFRDLKTRDRFVEAFRLAGLPE